MRDLHPLRRQPARSGPDWWTTPGVLIDLLTEHVLPECPPGPVWDVGAGDGRLLRAAQACPSRQGGIATDIEPRHPDVLCHNFLTDAPMTGGAVMIMNAPFSRKYKFLKRALALLDDNTTGINAVCFLLRIDTLGTLEVSSPLNRAAGIAITPKRPIWILGSKGHPRWPFCWAWWTRTSNGPPVTRSIDRRACAPAW